MPNCSLLAIGNELLNGEIRDLNLHTLSQSLTRLGFTVICATIARDTPESIARSVAFLLDASPDVLICSGGLGPTEDDLTLRSLAQSLGRDLVPDAEARRLVEAQYDDLLAAGYLEHRGPEAARAKMAKLPGGATPLPNPVGAAPGMRLQLSSTLIYALPGVPAELDAIFAESIVPELRRTFQLGFWAQQALRVHVDDEAEVAAPLRSVARRHPEVYLKSLAQPFPAAGREGLRIIASTQAVSSDIAVRTVRNALTDLKIVLQDAGLQVGCDEDLSSA